MFYFIGSFNDEDPDNWIAASGIDRYSKFDQYISSMYFAFTTIVSVGYGDILPVTKFERIFCMF